MRAGVLIWIDWIAGSWYRSAALLLVMGLANLAYAGFSLVLALRSRGDRVPLLRVVAAANVGWGVVCAVLAVVWFGRASLFGMGQLVGEAVFVGGLGVVEWRAAKVKDDVPGVGER